MSAQENWILFWFWVLTQSRVGRKSISLRLNFLTHVKGIAIPSNFTNQVKIITCSLNTNYIPHVKLLRKYRALIHRDRCSELGEKMSMTAWVVFTADTEPVQVFTTQVFPLCHMAWAPGLLTSEQHSYGFTAVSLIRPLWHLPSQFPATV